MLMKLCRFRTRTAHERNKILTNGFLLLNAHIDTIINMHTRFGSDSTDFYGLGNLTIHIS